MVALAGVGFAVVAAFCLAGQALTVRLATREGRTAHVLLVVLAVNAAVFVPLAFLLVPEPAPSRRAILAFAAAGLVSTMLGRACFYAGIKRVGASRAEPIKASMPLHATIFAVLLLGEPVSGPQAVGIALVVLGVALVSWEGSAADRLVGAGVPWVGLSLPFAGALLFSLEPIFATVGFREGTPILVGLAIKTAAAAAAFFAYLVATRDLPRPGALPGGTFRWYVLAGVANSAFLLAYYAGLSVSRVGVVVPIMQTSPLVVLAVSAVFFRDLERVTPRLIAAAGVIVAGAIAVTVAG